MYGSFFSMNRKQKHRKDIQKNETKNDKQYCGQIEINEKKAYYKKT